MSMVGMFSFLTLIGLIGIVAAFISSLDALFKGSMVQLKMAVVYGSVSLWLALLFRAFDTKDSDLGALVFIVVFFTFFGILLRNVMKSSDTSNDAPKVRKRLEIVDDGEVEEVVDLEEILTGKQ